VPTPVKGTCSGLIILKPKGGLIELAPKGEKRKTVGLVGQDLGKVRSVGCPKKNCGLPEKCMAEARDSCHRTAFEVLKGHEANRGWAAEKNRNGWV